MLIAAQCLVPSLQRTDVAWKEPTTHVCPQNLVLNAAMAIDNAILRLQLGNECVTESALERLAPEPLLCTAGVGLALFTVGFCTGTASSLFTAVVLRAHRFLVLDCWLLHRRHSWLWKNHRCLLGQQLATERKGKACPGKGRSRGRSWAHRRRARLCGVGLLQCGLLHGCRCRRRHLGCARCRRRQLGRILLGLHLVTECIGRIHFEEAAP